MTKIRIRNFGPIKEGLVENDGWLDVKKVSVFIGNQGSGKSTLAKLISTFSWMEKALTRGDYNIKDFVSYNRFRKNYCAYHRLENYFFDERGNDIADIEYRGKSYVMAYRNGALTIDETSRESYPLPQIMYVPAERNFISNVKNPKALKLTSDSLIEFVTEFDNAKNEIKEPIVLPIQDVNVEYDKLNDIVNIKGNDYKVRLTEASSGFQSLVPLFLVSRFLAYSVSQAQNTKDPMSSDELLRFKKGVEEIWSNDNLTDEQKRAALSVLSSKFNKTAFVNIVEEPEQNLFPTSQWEMLKSLLEFNNMNKANTLVVTTHSPYIVNYLSIAIEGGLLFKKISSKSDKADLERRLNQIVPLKSLVDSSDVVVYQFDERNGKINKLPQFEGIPSDKNFLNDSLKEGNHLFDSLLELEQAL